MIKRRKMRLNGELQLDSRNAAYELIFEIKITNFDLKIFYNVFLGTIRNYIRF
jgi:hypothetical protein